MTDNKLSNSQVIVIYVFLGIFFLVGYVQCRLIGLEESQKSINIDINSNIGFELSTIENGLCTPVFIADAEINNNPAHTIELYATRQNIKDMQTAIKI